MYMGYKSYDSYEAGDKQYLRLFWIETGVRRRIRVIQHGMSSLGCGSGGDLQSDAATALRYQRTITNSLKER
jgi:hypothetical protein